MAAMKKYLFLIFVFALAATDAVAQQNFLLKDASKNFDVKIRVAKCDFTDASYKTCEGRASVSLFKKNESRAFQTIEMPNLFLELGENKQPTANLIELYGENNSGVIFDDFNFDGAEDLALRNGNEGAYGGPSYDIYLFSKTGGGRFVKNAALSKLASENLGLFTVDKKEKTLETFNKSGCCYHETTRYKIVNNRPVKVYVFIEDAMSVPDGKVKLTTEKLVGGKWRKTTKTALAKDYYKEQ